MTYDKLIMRVDKKYINQLIELKLITNNKKITIKFLDEQHLERNESHFKLKEAGRKGGLATQKKAKLKQGLSKDKGIKENKIKEIIDKTINHPDPSQRMSRERAEQILNMKNKS